MRDAEGHPSGRPTRPRRPAAWLAFLARILIPSQHHEVILGDLEELYVRRAQERGRIRADLDFLRGTVVSAWALRTRGRGASGVDQRRPSPRWSGSRSGAPSGGLPSDVRYAFRRLRRRPGFSFMVVATLALGIGSTTAVFGMVNQLVLRPLPGAANSDRAAYLWLGENGSEGLTLPDFDVLIERATLLEGIASHGLTLQNVSLGDGRPISVRASVFYGDYFVVLGVEPAAGRLLSAADTELDADPLRTVISTSLRDRLFGEDVDPVGRTIRMNGQPVAVVGVAQPGFRGAERGSEIDAWLPHGALVPLVSFTRERLTSRNSAMHREILVLPRPGVSLEAVEEQVAQILEQIAEAVPESAEHLSRLTPTAHAGLQTPPGIRDVTGRTLSMMAWAVALILAVACANVANLLLFQNLARRGALATARALGASTARVTRQHLAESLALGVAGGAAGLAVAWGITRAFEGESLVRMPAFEGFAVDFRTGAFVVGAAVLAALVFGVVPAVLAGRFDLGAALRASGSRETGRIGVLRSGLAAGQIGLTLALVAGGLLMVRTIDNLQSVETGLDIENVASQWLRPPDDLEPEEAHQLYRTLIAETEAIPGVERVALDQYGPHGSSFRTQVAQPGRMPELTRRSDFRSLAVAWEVTPGWFELFGVPPIHGRVLVDDDWRVSDSDVVVLTESLARRVFGRSDVVGQRVEIRVSREPEERTVVGVVGDYRSLADPSETTDAVFLPHGQVRNLQMTIMARLSPGSTGAMEAMRGVAESLFPTVPIPEPTLLTERAERNYQEQLLLRRLLGILSVFGVVLSAVGLFGAVFFVVKHRQKEFGIRRALGADAGRIVRLIARATLWMITVGILLGLIASMGMTRVLESRLFGVGPFDPISFLGAAAVVLVAAVLACLAPTRVALQSDPVAVLREE